MFCILDLTTVKDSVVTERQPALSPSQPNHKGYFFWRKTQEVTVPSLITLSATSGTNYLFFFFFTFRVVALTTDKVMRLQDLASVQRHCVHAWSPRKSSKHQLFANSTFLLFFITANENVARRHTRRIFSLGSTGVLPSIIFSPKP